MKISLLAMSDNCAERGFLSSCHGLRGALEPFGDCRLEYCGGIRELFAALLEGLKSSGAMVVAVSPRQYIRCKKKLIQALGVPAVRDEGVYSRILRQGLPERSGEQAALHAAVAQGAVVFPSADGLYSGFAVESDGQHIVLIPADEQRLPEMTERELLPYFSRISGIPLTRERDQEPQGESAPSEVGPVPALAVPPADPAVLPPVPAAAEELHPGEEQAAAVPAPDPVGAARDAAAALARQKCTLAIAQSKTAPLVREWAGPAQDGEAPVVRFTSYTCERNQENPREYVARLAMGAREAADTDYGAAISNVFTSGAQTAGIFIYVAVADDREAHVQRLDLEEGETPEHLIRAAACALFRSAEQIVQASTVQRAVGDLPVIVAADPPQEQTGRLSRKAKIVIGACVSALVLVCVAMGLCLRTPSVSAFNAQDALDTITFYHAAAALEELPSEESTAEPESSTQQAIQPVTEEATRPAQKPMNDPEQAGGVGGESTEKPVIKEEQGPAQEEQPVDSLTGTFTITTYGYGHGVGMSQYGANEFAKAGWSFDQILLHYYPGTALAADALAGTDGIPTAEDIARVVQQEMGSGFEPQALRAQAVAAYTYARNHGNSISGMASVDDSSSVSEKVRTAVNEVYGQIVTYGGQPINAVFHAMSAGITAASQTVWGGSTPYLQPASSPGDALQRNYMVTRTYTAQEMADILGGALGVSMSGDPAGWLTILSHDSAVNAEIGYVKKIRIQIHAGTYTELSGNYFRESIMGYSRMRSPCFTLTYTA